MRVRRGCAVLMMCLCLLLGGCGGRSQGVSPAIAFRASLVQAGGCSFRAELTADYGDYVVPFALDCKTEVNGQTHFTVAAPETLAGITAAVDETGGTVTYDGLMMDFGLLANGRLAPAAGPAVVAYCWSSAYLAAGGEEDGGSARPMRRIMKKKCSRWTPGLKMAYQFMRKYAIMVSVF